MSAQTPVQLDVNEADVLSLMDEVGLAYALHTHHPLTHLEYGDKSTPEDINNRIFC